MSMQLDLKWIACYRVCSYRYLCVFWLTLQISMTWLLTTRVCKATLVASKNKLELKVSAVEMTISYQGYWLSLANSRKNRAFRAEQSLFVCFCLMWVTCTLTN